MRIHSLKLEAYKNLRELHLVFDPDSLYAVLLGQNGTGKSNVIEALVQIFRDLDLARPPAFAYELLFSRGGQEIEIIADPWARPHTRAAVDGVPLPFRRLTGDGPSKYLPTNVFGYYSGSSDRLAQHFALHHDRFARALREADSSAMSPLPQRPMFFARPEHSQFVLLTFFLEPDAPTRDFLRRYLHIERLHSVVFQLKKPSWANPRDSASDFWGARGVVRGFLEELRDQASRSGASQVGDPSGRGTEFVISDLSALDALYHRYSGQSDFFKTLESAYAADLIRELQINVIVEGTTQPVPLIELSEGERQIVTVLGLMRLTKDDESLFLLDEPATHLNPVWSLEYLRLLERIVGPGNQNQVILTTHDPLMISGLDSSQVQILLRDPETSIIHAKTPDEDPRGMGVAGVLTSELFGLRSALDLDTQELLERKRRLAVQPPDSRSDEEREELARLNEELRGLDFSLEVRDPLYRPFVDAMVASGRYPDLSKPVLAPDEAEELRELALEIVRRMPKEDPA